MEDLTLRRELKKGSGGKKVGLIQEWLCLHGIGLKVDQDFGPATQFGVSLFQKRRGLPETGTVDEATFDRLVTPMKNALAEIPAEGRSLGRMMILYAKQHLREGPREIGGQNKGPWVRLYMKGLEGKSYPWCAGFVCFILEKACSALEVPIPLKTSFSCSSLAKAAKSSGIFLKGDTRTDRERITPGSVFLNRGGSTGWAHTGIVVQLKTEVFLSIEGNTNDEGSHEGYEVSRRIRAFKKKDFIAL